MRLRAIIAGKIESVAPRRCAAGILGPRTLRAIAAAAILLPVLAAPVAAQFFPFGRSPPPPSRAAPGWSFFPFGRREAPPEKPVDYSHAPAPKKSETEPERHILVLGDAMADWLAYGLEDAFSETPEVGITRKHRTVSGLIHYQPKGDPADWAAAAKGILAEEKADIVVIMLGLRDRQAIREEVQVKDDKKDAKNANNKNAKNDTKKDDGAKGGAKPDNAAPPKAGAPNAASSNDKKDANQASIAAPEPRAVKKSNVYEFHSEKWIELYRKKIAEMIAVARSKGVPVIWVGLPPVRGTRSTAEITFLDSLYREEASKANITYVDVWDGFVDEAGRFVSYGPDFEGQTRRLRSGDGVFFTKAGARKLAHYAEREIRRILASRALPVALPSEPGTPDLSARPGGPPQRPIAGPIIPLVASTVRTDELLGGAGTRPAAIDALAARTLVKGEPLAPPPGRADDFVWPRRDVGSAPAADPVTATAPSSGTKPASSPASQSASAAKRSAQRDGTLRPPGAIGQPRQSLPRRRGFFFGLFGR